MKKVIIKKCMNLIKKNDSYNNTQLEEIEYGLTSLYLLISKLIIIFILGIVLGIVKEMIILMILYNIIRMPSFGIHASKSWICLVVSSLIFIIVPLICKSVEINIYIKSIIGIFGIITMYMYSPADTKKRPIVSIKRRNTYKFISVIIVTIYTLLSLIINDSYISNGLIFTIIIQSIIIHPLTYKIFNMSYDNYKLYSIKV